MTGTLETLLPAIGHVLMDRYELQREIDRGASSVVFAARHRGMGQLVSVKVLLPHVLSNQDMVRRFEQEVVLGKRLHHPNTIRVMDVGRTEKGLPFFVMEFLPGDTLKHHLKVEERLSPARTRRIAVQILGSLAEAHAAGIVHRDLKPGNLLMCEVPGTVDFVKVLDFGVAKAMTFDGPMGTMTKSGIVIGTPAYMSPEQARGSRNVDARSDLYSLGLVMIECLTGQRAIEADTLFDVVARFAGPEPSILDHGIESSALGPVIEKATRHIRQERFRSAEEMMDALEALGDLPTSLVRTKPRSKWRPPQHTPHTLPATTMAPASRRRFWSSLLASGVGLWGRRQRRWLAALAVVIGAVALLLFVAVDRQDDPGGLAAEEGATAESPSEAAQRPPDVAAHSPSPAVTESISPALEQASRAAAVEGAQSRLAGAIPASHTIHFGGTRGAAVSLDGRRLGRIPFEVRHPLVDAEVDVRVSRRGFETAREAVSLSAEEIVLELRPRRTRMSASDRQSSEHGRSSDSSSPDTGNDTNATALPFGEMGIYPQNRTD